MYYGEATTVLDDKGRITVPKKFRDTMHERKDAYWYMTRGFNNCLSLFPLDEWRRLQSQLDRYSSMDPESLRFRRMFLGSVAEVSPDGQGRIPVTGPHRERAELRKDVIVVGVGPNLEIWSKERWEEYQSGEDAEGEYEAMARKLLGRLDEAQTHTEGGIHHVDH